MSRMAPYDRSVCPFGVAPVDAGHVMQPPHPARGVVEAELDRDLLQPPGLELCGHVEEAVTVLGVHALQVELHGLKALVQLRGKAEDVSEPCVEEGGALAVVRLVEPEAGELGGRLQPSLAHANRLLGGLAIGDVDGHAHQAVRLPRGLHGWPATGVDPPHAAIGRGDDPVHHVDGFAGPRRPLEGIPDGAPVVGMDRRLETRHVEDFVRRIPEQRPSPLRRPEGAGAVVEGPEPRLGGVRRQGQALLALPQAQVVAPAGERVAEDLRDELQPLHQRVRPVALGPQGVEGQRADRRLASQREREGQVRPEPSGGQLSRSTANSAGISSMEADHDRAAGHHLARRPTGTAPGAAARQVAGLRRRT